MPTWAALQDKCKELESDLSSTREDLGEIKMKSRVFEDRSSNTQHILQEKLAVAERMARDLEDERKLLSTRLHAEESERAALERHNEDLVAKLSQVCNLFRLARDEDKEA